MGAVKAVIKRIAIPFIAVLVTVAIGIALLMSGILPFSLQLSTADGAAPEIGIATPTPAPTPVPYYNELEGGGAQQLTGGIFYDVGQRIVNLADPGGYRFLRIGLVLEFLPSSPDYYTLTGDKLAQAEETFLVEVERQRPLIDNVIIDVLTAKQFDTIFTVEGKQALRAELQEELNRNLRNRYVNRVLITDFVIQ
jgi:flagellar basal body-associated protein FliL